MLITAQELFKRGAGISRVAKIILVDLANCQQSFDPMLASWVFSSQKLVLADGRIQSHVVFEMPSHLCRQFSNGESASVGLAGSRRIENDLTIRSDCGLVLAPSTCLCGMTVEGFAP